MIIVFHEFLNTNTLNRKYFRLYPAQIIFKSRCKWLDGLYFIYPNITILISCIRFKCKKNTFLDFFIYFSYNLFNISFNMHFNFIWAYAACKKLYFTIQRIFLNRWKKIIIKHIPWTYVYICVNKKINHPINSCFYFLKIID